MQRIFSTTFELLALFVIIFIAVGLFYRLVSAWLIYLPPQDVYAAQSSRLVERAINPTAVDYQIIVKRNIFGTKKSQGDDLENIQLEALEPTSLDLKLIGTVAGDKQNSRAIIMNLTSREQNLYRIGDELMFAVVADIQRKRVIFRVGDGKYEILSMEDDFRAAMAGKGSGSGPGPGPTIASARTITTRTLDREELQQSMKDINEIITQVKIRPYFADGKVEGLMFAEMEKGSVFEKLGFQDGDIVQRINGKAIQSPNDVIDLYNDMQSNSNFSIDLKRGGRQNTLNFNLK